VHWHYTQNVFLSVWIAPIYSRSVSRSVKQFELFTVLCSFWKKNDLCHMCHENAKKRNYNVIPCDLKSMQPTAHEGATWIEPGHSDRKRILRLNRSESSDHRGYVNKEHRDSVAVKTRAQHEDAARRRPSSTATSPINYVQGDVRTSSTTGQLAPQSV